ncbi:MAG: phasin family protein [Candidatus Schekmanbacteria bacterium]|nr:phasin family protein [Candidatus Schekmanbacteria bacterium]
MARSALLDSFEKSSRDLATKGTHLISQTYLASLGVFEIAREQSSGLVDKLVTRGEKVEHDGKEYLRKQLTEQKDILESWRREVVSYAEGTLERFRTSVQGRFDLLATAIEHLESRLKKLEATVAELPVHEYDKLTAKEIQVKLEELDVEQMNALRAHEAEHKNRVTVMEAIDGRLKKLETETTV